MSKTDDIRWVTRVVLFDDKIAFDKLTHFAANQAKNHAVQ